MNSKKEKPIPKDGLVGLMIVGGSLDDSTDGGYSGLLAVTDDLIDHIGNIITGFLQLSFRDMGVALCHTYV